MNSNITPDPRNIYNKILKSEVDVVLDPLIFNFNKSPHQGNVPGD